MRAYIDSNIFVFACVSEDALGENCRKLLDSIVKGNLDAVTTALTFDEVFYKLSKLKGFDSAVLFTENFLQMPNLALAKVDESLVALAFGIVKKHKLAPRDALHTATAIAGKAEFLISEDREFSKVFSRISAKDAVAKIIATL